MVSGIEIEINGLPRALFTAPWEPVVVRRGDALGLRALADQLADAVAPGLSNRVSDGRWVTILAWCLARSHEVFHASRGRSVQTRAEQLERYAWLRPLELMWVARTIVLADDWRNRSLSGQRRVRPWYEDDEMSTDRFGMSTDQFRAYRQTGMYGGYRLAFRKWPGMTLFGDGWTPGPSANRLAQWMDGKLGQARPSWPLHRGADYENSPIQRVPKLGKGDRHDWWLRHWPSFDRGGRSADKNTLPRRKTEYCALPERDLLKPVVFADDVDGKRRRDVAQEVLKAAAPDHSTICKHLGHAFGHDRAVVLLPRFARLADAGMSAMDVVANALHGSSRAPLSDVAARAEAREACAELMAAAKEWLRGAEMEVRHVETAHRFASAIHTARPKECLRALLEYHETYGGGLRWFVIRNGKVEPRTPQRLGSSRYRFRLWSLCRIAVQCGLIRDMPSGLSDEADDESSEASDE